MEFRVSSGESESKLIELNNKNDVPVYDVHSEGFETFGRVLTEYDVSDLVSFMEENTEIPTDGNVYVPSVEELETFPIAKTLETVFYGGMPLQIGYCNGRNTTYNGFEFHKCSEINIAVTDFVLSLGKRYDILDNRFDNDNTTLFFVEKGTVIELFQTTLHLSPLRVTDEGFKCVVVLPKGTNTPLSDEEKAARDAIIAKDENAEARLLLHKNKWVISHPERKPLIEQGAFAGIIGENKELKY